MKIKTAYIIETFVRVIVGVLILPFYVIGWILLQLAKPFEWVVQEAVYIMAKFGYYLFLKSKMADYVKNETYKRTLTARTAYKLKKQILQ